MRLFRYLDKNGNGVVGYEEFTLLTEERWRGLDPFEKKYDGAYSSSRVMLEVEDETKFEDCDNFAEKLDRLEDLSKNHLKVPLKKEDKFDN